LAQVWLKHPTRLPSRPFAITPNSCRMARASCTAVMFVLAAAVVQANHCSSGGECPSDDEPQNLASLLQTKLRMNVLEDGPSMMMKDPSAMLAVLEGMVRSGETPAFDLITTIKNLIEDDIMPGLENTRDAADVATRDALREIQSCNNKSKTEEANIEATYEKAVDDTRSLHAACREAQKMLHDHNLTDSDAYCVKLGEFLHGATPLAVPEGSTRDQSVKYVQEATLENMCDSTKVCELDDGCTAAEAELEDKKAECSAAQRSFESAFCTWKLELENNCRNLDTCHSEAVAAYDSHVDKTGTLVEKWDVETAALHKILCYCNVWLAEKDDCDNRSTHNATQFDVCKDQTYSPNLVNYGTAAAKVVCSLTSVANYPGTSGFVTQEYDSFTGFVDSVVPCSEAPFPAPTPAPTPASTPAESTTAPLAPDPPQCSRDWAMGEIGEVNECPPGYAVISDLTTCQVAATSLELGSVERLTANSISSTYPGCHASSGHVLFNTHPNPVGAEHSEHSQQVCMCEAPTEPPTPAPTPSPTPAPTPATTPAFSIVSSGETPCGDGLYPVVSAAECQAAAAALGKTYLGTMTSPLTMSNCMYYDTYEELQFNIGGSGTGHGNAVCTTVGDD